MNLPIEQFIPSGSVLVTGIVGLTVAWFKFQNKVDNLEEDRKEDRDRHEEDMARIKEVNVLQWSKIDEINKWEILHEKESTERRTTIEVKIAKIEGSLTSLVEKLDTMNDNFNSRFDKLEIGLKEKK